MVWAALKFVALLLVVGVGMDVGDGNEFDGVDCGVAAKPPGYAKGPESGKRPNGQPPRPGDPSGLQPTGSPSPVALPSDGREEVARAAGRYELREEFGGWRLVFDGRERLLGHTKGLAYVAVLLVDRPGEAIHATELANRAFGDAVVEQRNLAADDREAARRMAETRRKCQAVIDDPGASEVERQEARGELDGIVEWARSQVRGTEGNEQRQVRAIRQAIRRLLWRLRAARDGEGAPDAVLRAFGEHLERYLCQPSGRRARDGALRVRAGLAGRFIYEAPEGVRWRG
jgi:hypothetical protein